jgi:hypothetical protein
MPANPSDLPKRAEEVQACCASAPLKIPKGWGSLQVPGWVPGWLLGLGSVQLCPLSWLGQALVDVASADWVQLCPLPWLGQAPVEVASADCSAE